MVQQPQTHGLAAVLPDAVAQPWQDPLAGGAPTAVGLLAQSVQRPLIGAVPGAPLGAVDRGGCGWYDAITSHVGPVYHRVPPGGQTGPIHLCPPPPDRPPGLPQCTPRPYLTQLQWHYLSVLAVEGSYVGVSVGGWMWGVEIRQNATH